MELFGAIISGAFSILQIEFVLFGFPFSFWQVLLWSCFIGLSMWIVFKLMNGD